MNYKLVTTASEEQAKSTVGLTRNPTWRFYKFQIEITSYKYTGHIFTITSPTNINFYGSTPTYASRLSLLVHLVF